MWYNLNFNSEIWDLMIEEAKVKVNFLILSMKVQGVGQMKLHPFLN